MLTCITTFTECINEISFKVNGARTLSENIADNTGLEISWKAYKMAREKFGTNYVNISGSEPFTEEKLFFLSFANVSNI